MPEDIEGSFDGGGSVRWEIVVEEDDDRKGESKPEGIKGRRNKGVDRKAKTYFRILMKAPAREPQRQAFLEQFARWLQKDTVEVRLPLARVDKQIRVKWDGEEPLVAPGTSTSA